MKIFNFYLDNIVNYDLIHKFNFKTVKNLPKLKKIILTFNLKNYNFKDLLVIFSALKIMGGMKSSKISKSKTSNINLKVRKGTPIGCTVVLRNEFMKKFLFNIIYFKFIEKKNIKFVKYNKNIFSFKVNNLLKVNKLRQNYEFFQNLPVLNVNIITTSTKKNVLLFLLKSYKLF